MASLGVLKPRKVGRQEEGTETHGLVVADALLGLLRQEILGVEEDGILPLERLLLLLSHYNHKMLYNSFIHTYRTYPHVLFPLSILCRGLHITISSRHRISRDTQLISYYSIKVSCGL